MSWLKKITFNNTHYTNTKVISLTGKKKRVSQCKEIFPLTMFILTNTHITNDFQLKYIQ